MLSCVERRNRITNILARREVAYLLILSNHSSISPETFYNKNGFEKFVEEINLHVFGKVWTSYILK